MRYVALLLLVTSLVWSATLTVSWYPAIVKHTANGVQLIKGPKVLYVKLSEPKIFFLCFKLNGTNGDVTAKLYADVRAGAPSEQDVFKLKLTNGKEKCVMVPLKPEKATEIQTNQLNQLISEISKGKISVPKISVVLQNFLGYYVDVYVNTGNDRVIFYRYGYLRVLPAEKGCLNVTFTPNEVVPIGGSVKVNIVNTCTKPVMYKVAIDMVQAPDITLKEGKLNPGQNVSYTLSIPNKVGRRAFEITGPISEYPNGMYVAEIGEKEVIDAFLPAYNYYAFYIIPNLKASWYYEGVKVKEVPSGASVKGCLSVPNLVPYESVPTLSGTMEVIQDRAFLPDVIVQKTGVVISKLPFEVCTVFTAKSGWGVRGYKLQLNVQGLSASASPELKLK